MTRWMFPQDRLTFQYGAPGTPLYAPQGETLTICTDEAGTIPADIQTPEGVSIEGSYVSIGANCLIPEFLGPNDGTTVLYAVNGTIVTELTAEVEPRLDAFETAAPTTYVLATAVGADNGVASLDSTGKVPTAQLPASSSAVTSVNGHTGVVVLAASDVGALTESSADGRYAQISTVPVVGAAGSGAAKALSANDPTTTNSRSPLPHAGTHAAAGADPVTPAAIGAAAVANNLSDVNASASRANLGLGNSATRAVGTTTGTVAAGDDSRITGAVQATVLTTKGDLLAGTGSGVARQAAGSNGQILSADSTQANGVKWIAPPSGSPTGAAGGDLTGSSYPDPVVAKIQGVAISGSPTTGQVLTASGSAAAAWADPSSTVDLNTDPTAIAPLGTRAAGSTDLAADAGHVHAMPRLDQVLAPTASVALGSQKLTGGANGTASTDVALFGQIPLVGAAGAGAGVALSSTDATVTNARTPTAHAASHASAGSDPVSPASIGAAAVANNLSDVNAATSRTNLGLGTAAVANIGTSSGTVASGTDTRITGAAQKSANLTDLASIPSALTALGIGGAGLLNVGTTTGTVAAGDDSRITGAAQKSANLTDLSSAPAARTALGLGGAAVLNVGTTSGTVMAGNDSRIAGALPAATWRRRDLPNLNESTKLYEGPDPIITLTQATTSTISSAVTYAPNTANFQYVGAGDFQFGTVFPDTNYYLPTSRYPHTYATPQQNWAVEFETDAQVFEWGFKYISSATMYRLSIDGRPVTDLTQTTGATSVGSGYMLKFDLRTGLNVPKRIRIDFETMPFRGVYLGPTDYLWKPVIPGDRLMVFGDSISDGSANNAGGGIGTWFYRTGRMLGCSDNWEQGRGGTGYITAGSYDTLPNRLAADVVAYTPNRLIVWAGYNDNGGSQTAIGSAASGLYASIASGLPSCQTYVIGCWSPTGSPAGSITSTDATIQTAALGASLPFISPITGSVYNGAGTLVTTLGPWITGTGRVGSTTGSGIADWAIGVDGVHPTDAGHVYVSRRIFSSLRALMPA